MQGHVQHISCNFPRRVENLEFRDKKYIPREKSAANSQFVNTFEVSLFLEASDFWYVEIVVFTSMEFKRW